MSLLTVGQAADQLNISPRTVYRLIAEGRLTVVRPTDGRTRIPADVLAAYITARTVPASESVEIPA